MSHLKPRVKHVSLAFLGEGWGDAYIDFTALTFPDLERMDTADQTGKSVRQLLRDKFLAGRAIDTDNQPFDLTADDVDKFDIETLGEFVKALSGQPSPND